MSRLAASIPGALGYYDYFNSTAAAWGPTVFGVGMLVSVMMLLGLLASETARARSIKPA